MLKSSGIQAFLKTFTPLLRAGIQMKNQLLWLSCLSWFRHGLKFMPSVHVPTYMTISSSLTDRCSDISSHQVQMKSTWVRLNTLPAGYIRRNTFLMRLNFLSLHAEQKGLASQLKQDHRFLDTNDPFTDSDIPQTTVFLPFVEQQFSARDNCVSAPTKYEPNELRWLGYPKGWGGWIWGRVCMGS